MGKINLMKRKDSKEKVKINHYSGFPMSLIDTIHSILILALVLGLPFLILFFKESISGYANILLLFLFWSVLRKLVGNYFE